MNSGMSTLASAVRLALFSVLTLAATTLLAMTITNYSGASTNTYKAVFSDATNLVHGDEVRDAGVRVGTIKGVSLIDGTRARVTFTVDTAVTVTSGTELDIRYRNLIGQRYLAVVDGPARGVGLPDGSTLTNTKPALNLTTLFNGFRPLLHGLSPDDVNNLSYDLIQVLQGEGGTVDDLLGQVGSVTTTLANHDALIGQVIDNLNGALGPVAAHDQQLSALLSNLQQFLTGLSHDRKAIGGSLASINDLASTTSSLLSKARPDLAADVKNLGKLVEGLDSKGSRKVLKHFLTYTPFKLQVATPEVTYGAFLNFYVCGANFIMPDGSQSRWFVNTTERCG